MLRSVNVELSKRSLNAKEIGVGFLPSGSFLLLGFVQLSSGEPIFLVGSLFHPVVSDLCKGATRAAILTWKHLSAQIVQKTLIFPNRVDVVHLLEHLFCVGKKHVEEALNNFGHVDVVHGRHLDQGHVVHWVGILENDDMFFHDCRGHHQSVGGGHPADVINDNNSLHCCLSVIL